MTAATVDAIIFDMDGLLIDSEPLWRIAEVETLSAVGVPITEEDAVQTTGPATRGRTRRKRRSRRGSSLA
jgi:mannitol-1-/sugar-/sorbitol-6-/2-deoxyglucose-6-phosphatase